MIPQIQLKPGRESSLKRKHPWVYSGAIDRTIGDPDIGDTVEILDANGEKLATAAYSMHSSIRARIWSFNPKIVIDEEFIKSQVKKAIAARTSMQKRDALRLIHAESDGIPGFIADQYDNWLVVQFLSAGAEKFRKQIVDSLVEISGCQNIFERSDVDIRKLESLPLRSGVLRGEEPPDHILITEHDIQYLVDIRSGHKTGFYLDQYENRHTLRSFAEGKDVLNCFCFTGGFALNAAAGGARSIYSIDTSKAALEIAIHNYALNKFEKISAEWIERDVFQELRTLRDRACSFDLIVLDPPKLAATKAQVKRAARAYKDLNLLAFKLLRPGGHLFTFSCSGGIGKELFHKIVADAALDAKVNAVIVRQMSQSGDHPIALNFPEGEYLKGLICQVR